MRSRASFQSAPRRRRTSGSRNLSVPRAVTAFPQIWDATQRGGGSAGLGPSRETGAQPKVGIQPQGVRSWQGGGGTWLSSVWIEDRKCAFQRAA
jgi:hypothetical protein